MKSLLLTDLYVPASLYRGDLIDIDVRPEELTEGERIFIPRGNLFLTFPAADGSHLSVSGPHHLIEQTLREHGYPVEVGPHELVPEPVRFLFRTALPPEFGGGQEQIIRGRE